MLYNVAQLLKAVVGDTRVYDVDELFGPCPEVAFAGAVAGQVQLTRVNQGIVARAALHAPVELECSRCLEPFVQDLELSFEERYIPTVDVLTGVPVHDREEDEDEEEVYTIDDHHLLDLHEAVRQQAVMNLPMQPLHAATCAGLCPSCGANHNDGPCRCQPASAADPRFAALQDWLGRNAAGQ